MAVIVAGHSSNTRAVRREHNRLDLRWGRMRLMTSDLIGAAHGFADGPMAIMDRHQRRRIAAYAARLQRKAQPTNLPTKGFA